MSSGGARIASVHVVLPPNRYAQQDVTETLASMVFGGDEAGRGVMSKFHASAGVRNRHLTLPLERYSAISGFGEANDAFIDGALDYGAEAVSAALGEAGLRASDVDLFVATSVTGVAVPSVDARLAGALGMRPDVKRLPIFGLGCVAGAAGLARVHDYLLAWPDHVAVLLSVELCSLTWQRADRSPANLVASALFGDGAAAVVACGAARGDVTGPRVVATRSRLYPDTERVMGWDVGDSGFSVVLGADVPDVVRRYLADDVHAFLAEHGLTAPDIATWVCHPGGPKVLEAVQDALALPDDALALTWRSLADVGNLSSASVLYVLRDTLHERRPPPGGYGLLLAMGPGFCAELVLLRW
ncbi:MAG: type III polyketide synthase [Streptosporangiales bacterium]|nr:type III polyketide synthase [Streptosporangiales bacterium]MBO0889539.1 type III polyketide synthase [Acidothermales bacterium]